jgi:hypothetical protein
MQAIMKFQPINQKKMKHNHLPASISLVLTLVIIGYAVWQCTDGGLRYNIITISGSSGHSFNNNLSKTYLKFGSLADSGKTTAMLVSEGDILYLLDDPSDNPIIFRYRLSDGQHLKLTTDTASLYKSILNDKLYGLCFSDPEDVAKWKKQKDLTSFTGLRVIYINGSALQDDISFLDEIAGLNAAAGLVLEGLNQEQLTRVMSMFSPEWLFLMDTGFDIVSDDLVQHMEHLETMILDAEYAKDVDFLYQLPNLRSLVTEGSSASDSAFIHFDRMRNLVSLSILSSDIESLSSIDLPPDINSLFLIDCDRLTDINGLNELKKLKQLSLLACDTLTDLAVLKELPPLQMLSLPPGITQQDFAQITGHHQSSLQALEIIGCEGITDLSPLTQLQGLISLAIDNPVIDFTILEQLTGIKLIVIEQSHFDASPDQVASLAKALPGAQIVPGGGFCMGSGWILLMLPVLLVAGILTRKRRKR